MKEHPTLKGYFVTEDGKVFSNKWGRLKELKRTPNCKGYETVYIKRKPRKVHRLVAETYIPNPDNLPMINHKDEDKTNNHISNLEWCNVQYNNEYSHSKWYKIKTPTNEIIEVFNLTKFCRENNLHPGHLSSLGKSRGFSLIR